MMADNLSNTNFNEIVNLIHTSKQKAFERVNTTLLELYWDIGKYISQKTIAENWGKSVVKELASFIKIQDPTIKGFSDKNLWRMKQFYEVYKDETKLATLWRVLSWSHNKRILSLKTMEERVFYLKTCIKEKYSVRELDRQINSSLFERIILGNEKLSPVVRQLPQDTTNVFKDVYSLEFLDIKETHSEKDLQKALLSSLREFILELGIGFAFIAQEYRVSVGNSDFYIDLLFFHRHLKCLIAIELKIGHFKPTDLGQLEFYLEALDRDVKTDDENPSIGVLLCREKDDEVVEYALSRSLSPTVIAEYETKLIPKELLRQKLNEFYERLESKDHE